MAKKEKQAAADDDSPKPVDPKPVHIGGESLADRILPHVKKIMVMFVLVAVAVSVILFIRWRKHVGQAATTAQLVSVMDVVRKDVEPDKPGAGSADVNKDVFKDHKTRAEAVLAEMIRKGADGGPTFKAAMLFDAGKYDEAIVEYRKSEKVAGIDGVLAREGLGITLEAKAFAAIGDNAAQQKLYEEALAVFTTMQPDEAGPRRAHALYHMGRIQQTLHKLDEARALFEKAKPLALTAEPPTQDPRVNEMLLPQLIERRLATM